MKLAKTIATTLFFVVLVLALTGCASMNQAYAAYGAVAVTGAQATNDNVIATWKVAACATPFSAMQRNPEIIDALRVLCVAPTKTSASALLDEIAADAAIYKIGKRP